MDGFTTWLLDSPEREDRQGECEDWEDAVSAKHKEWKQRHSSIYTHLLGFYEHKGKKQQVKL